MALSFQQEPVDSADKVPVITNWNPVVGYMLKESTISGLYYFKLVLEVYIGASAVATKKIAKLKQRRNGYPADVSGNAARAYFDLKDIVNSQLVDTVYDQNSTAPFMKTIHKLGSAVTTKPFSWNGDQTKTYGDDSTPKSQLLQIFVKGYQHYSSAENTSPEDDISGAVTDSLYWTNATLPLFTPRDTDDDYLQGTHFQVFQLNDDAARFLSDVQQSGGDVVGGSVYRNYVQDTDYHTLGFLNGETDFDSKGRYFVIKYYDSSGTEINAATEKQLSNKYSAGGAKPLTADNEVDLDKERIIYVGCGPGNLEAQTYDNDAKPSNNAGWAYYTIKASSNGGVSGNDMSALYYFIKQDGSCKGFKVRRLAWRNSLGCWDYFNFKMKSEQSINIERNTYSSMLGDFDGRRFSYNDSERGERTRETSATLEETLNTDWLTEQDAELLEGLMVSTNVEVVENADTDYTQGVVIADNSFVRKTVANDKMIQYTIKIKYANPLNTNS